MIKYTKEEIRSLIDHLWTYKGEEGTDPKTGQTVCAHKYFIFLNFLEEHFKKGSFDLGLTIPESTGCQVITWELKDQFPDFLLGLGMTDNDLPLYIADKTCYQYPIAVWRLSRARSP